MLAILIFIPNESIDFICTPQPYVNIIHYGDSINGDLSNYDVRDFLVQMKSVAAECYRALRSENFCAILMSDARKKGFLFR